MKEKPILFNTAMVKAILDGRKTETRRILKTDKLPDDDITFGYTAFTPDGHISVRGNYNGNYGESFIKLPYNPGDTLYVRETFAEKNSHYLYRADGENADIRWKPSLHMPRDAARIFLRVAAINIEPLQKITGRACLREGVDNGASNPAMGERWENMQKQAYAELWDTTVPKNEIEKFGWAANPFVWVIKFERI